jgi:hypothetical protein
VPQSRATHPHIEHSLAPRLRVSIKQHRITLLRIEIRRLHHPAVELHAFADVDLEEFGRRRFQLRELLLRLVIVDQCSYDCVLRQANHFRHRNFVEARINVNGKLAAR